MTSYTTLWRKDRTLPSRENMTHPSGAKDVMVHRAGDDGYSFLHDAAVVAHQDALFAAWYNCPEGEIVGESLIRCRISRDGGHTWADPHIIALDRDGTGTFYVPVQLLSWKKTLFAFVANMVGHDLVTCCEVFRLEEETADSHPPRWRSCGAIADGFLPNCAPVPLDSGGFAMA